MKPSQNYPADTSPAELPPGMDAPSPAAEVERIARGRGANLTEVESDLRSLASRVGGIRRLRELVTELERAGG